MRPLREGIQQLLRNKVDVGRVDNPLKMKRFDDIRVYFDTKLVVPKCTQTGLAYIVQFDIQPLKVSLLLKHKYTGTCFKLNGKWKRTY